MPNLLNNRIMAPAIAACLLVAASASAQSNPGWERQLNKQGFAIDSDEAVQRLIDTNDHGLQFSAVHALARLDSKPQAISRLKRFLDVDDMEIRAKAASKLADLGDRSALPRMQEDFRRYVPEDYAQSRDRDKRADNCGSVFRRMRREKQSFLALLEVAIACAKLGDVKVAPFIEYYAIWGTLPAYRYRAVEALVRLTVVADDEELKNEMIQNPEDLMLVIALRENNRSVRQTLAGELLRADVPKELALNIYDALKGSSHCTDLERKTLEILIKQKTEGITQSAGSRGKGRTKTPTSQPAAP